MKRVFFIILFLIYGASFLWLVIGIESQSSQIVFLTSGLISLLTVPLISKKSVVRGYIALVFVLLILSGSLLSSTRNDHEAPRAKIAGIVIKSSMKMSLHRFRLDVGRFPTTAEGLNALLRCPTSCEAKWHGPYVDSEGGQLELDPWRRPYQYVCPGIHNPNGYDLWSLGEDGKQSADDVCNWR